MRQKALKRLAFQIMAPPQGDSVILEVLDDQDEACMDVRIDSNGTRFVTVYALPGQDTPDTTTPRRHG